VFVCVCVSVCPNNDFSIKSPLTSTFGRPVNATWLYLGHFRSQDRRSVSRIQIRKQFLGCGCTLRRNVGNLSRSLCSSGHCDPEWRGFVDCGFLRPINFVPPVPPALLFWAFSRYISWSIPVYPYSLASKGLATQRWINLNRRYLSQTTLFIAWKVQNHALQGRETFTFIVPRSCNNDFRFD